MEERHSSLMWHGWNMCTFFKISTSVAGFLADILLNTLVFTLFYFLFIVLQLLGIITKSIKRTFLAAYIFFLCHWFMDFIELLTLQIVLSYKGKNC